MAARTDVVARLRPWVAASYERVSRGQSAARLAYRSSLLLHEGRPEPGPGGEAAASHAQDIETEHIETELADVADVRWELGTFAEILVRLPGGLAPGEHEITVNQRLRVSYMPILTENRFTRKVEVDR